MPCLPNSVSPEECNPSHDFWRTKIPSYNRRARWHDYHSRCHYMVTILRNEKITTPFCRIIHNGYDSRGAIIPEVKHLVTGDIILQQIHDTIRHYPSVRIPNHVIMPDHIHLHIFMTEYSGFTLGEVVNYFKGHCTKGIRKNGQIKEIGMLPLFHPGFNDRIVTRQGMKDNLINYIKDNPRRYLIKKILPDLFTRDHLIAGIGEQLPVFGNILLLKEPYKCVVTVSSHDSEDDLSRKKERWEEVVRQGGVIVSPFFGAPEKRLRDEYIEMGAKVILLKTGCFSNRFKPQGKDFELCMQGRLLIIGEGEEPELNKVIKRDTCLRLNKRASMIASAPCDGWVLKREGRL